MTITIHSTSKIVALMESGRAIPARIWEGVTDTGTPVHCYVTRICPTIALDDPRQALFAEELQECPPPSTPGVPQWMIL